MPFQKTLILARKAKGCADIHTPKFFIAHIKCRVHLCTDEIVGQIKQGLQGVDIGDVNTSTLCISGLTVQFIRYSTTLSGIICRSSALQNTLQASRISSFSILQLR